MLMGVCNYLEYLLILINTGSDPYVKVCVANGNSFIEDPANSLEWSKTPKVVKNLNPVWEKDNEFVLDVVDVKKQKLWFMVHDYDRIGSDDNLGSTWTSFENVKQNKPESRCLLLTGGEKKKNEGQLFVELEALDFDGTIF